MKDVRVAAGPNDDKYNKPRRQGRNEQSSYVFATLLGVAVASSVAVGYLLREAQIRYEPFTFSSIPPGTTINDNIDATSAVGVLRAALYASEKHRYELETETEKLLSLALEEIRAARDASPDDSRGAPDEDEALAADTVVAIDEDDDDLQDLREIQRLSTFYHPSSAGARRVEKTNERRHLALDEASFDCARKAFNALSDTGLTAFWPIGPTLRTLVRMNGGSESIDTTSKSVHVGISIDERSALRDSSFPWRTTTRTSDGDALTFETNDCRLVVTLFDTRSDALVTWSAPFGDTVAIFGTDGRVCSDLVPPTRLPIGFDERNKDVMRIPRDPWAFHEATSSENERNLLRQCASTTQKKKMTSLFRWADCLLLDADVARSFAGSTRAQRVMERLLGRERVLRQRRSRRHDGANRRLLAVDDEVVILQGTAEEEEETYVHEQSKENEAHVTFNASSFRLDSPIDDDDHNAQSAFVITEHLVTTESSSSAEDENVSTSSETISALSSLRSTLDAIRKGTASSSTPADATSTSTSTPTIPTRNIGLWCSALHKQYDVVVGHSWGTMPPSVQLRWREANCDRYVVDAERAASASGTKTIEATYTVREGDTLQSIGARFGARAEEIAAWNSDRTVDELTRPGSVLALRVRLDKDGSHVVAGGARASAHDDESIVDARQDDDGQQGWICDDTCVYARDGRCDETSGRCLPGTDCTDCGVRRDDAASSRTQRSFSEPLDDQDALVNIAAGAPRIVEDDDDDAFEDYVCKNTCATAGDGVCTDGGSDTTYSASCAPGTDCKDCGMRSKASVDASAATFVPDYTVRAGESAHVIAARASVSVRAFLRVNEVENDDTLSLQPGDEVLLPSASARTTRDIDSTCTLVPSDIAAGTIVDRSSVDEDALLRNGRFVVRWWGLKDGRVLRLSSRPARVSQTRGRMRACYQGTSSASRDFWCKWITPGQASLLTRWSLVELSRRVREAQYANQKGGDVLAVVPVSSLLSADVIEEKESSRTTTTTREQKHPLTRNAATKALVHVLVLYADNGVGAHGRYAVQSRFGPESPYAEFDARIFSVSANDMWTFEPLSAKHVVVRRPSLERMWIDRVALLERLAAEAIVVAGRALPSAFIFGDTLDGWHDACLLTARRPDVLLGVAEERWTPAAMRALEAGGLRRVRTSDSSVVEFVLDSFCSTVALGEIDGGHACGPTDDPRASNPYAAAHPTLRLHFFARSDVDAAATEWVEYLGVRRFRSKRIAT